MLHHVSSFLGAVLPDASSGYAFIQWESGIAFLLGTHIYDQWKAGN